MEAACAPFFCSASEHAFTLHSSPFLRPPVFIGIPRGEEFTATLHPLFTTLHRFQRPTGVNCSARPLGVKERCKTARRPWGGCAISLDNSWRITVDHRMHITCCACAYQLLCKRTTAVVRPKILTVSTTYPISFNNKKRVNHKLMTHPPLNQPGWRVVKSGWRVPKNSSPLGMPINTWDSEGKVKSEEFFLIPYLQQLYRHLR